MTDLSHFETWHHEPGRETAGLCYTGRWFRRGNQIVVVLDGHPHPAGRGFDGNPGELEETFLGGLENVVGQLGDALRRGMWSLAVGLAIQRGERNENRLTDMVFNARHPKRHGRRLQLSERLLVKEWLDIRNHIVRPALQMSAPGPSPVTPVRTQTAGQPPSTTSGVEASGNTTHIIQCILGLQDKGRPISFIVRYLRELSRTEAVVLRDAGLRVVSCYEAWSSTGTKPTQVAYFTHEQGQHDGRVGFSQAHAVGQPAGTPVYFAVDTDAGANQRQAILDYLKGVQDGYSQYLSSMHAQNKPAISYAIGIYGSGCVLNWAKAQGIATWFWQAFAPGWCNNRHVWLGVNIHTAGRDRPERCHWRLGRLEGWGNEGGW